MNFEKFTAPTKALNELAISNIEKLAALQLSFAEKSIQVAVASLKSASAVTDLEGLKSFYSDQNVVAKGLVEDVVASTSTIAEIGKSYAEDAKGIVETAIAA
jgi:phasin family protein